MSSKKRLIGNVRKLLSILRDYNAVLAAHLDIIAAFTDELKKELTTYEDEESHTNSQQT